jgi:type IX secretion system PorP/SprF family membrane protein
MKTIYTLAGVFQSKQSRNKINELISLLTKIFILFLLIAISVKVKGQQIPVFSAYYFNRYLVNPAFSGIDNQYRAFGFYRSQWANIPGRPVTGGSTVEGSFWKDQIGIGLNVTNDQAGAFNQTTAGIAYAQKFRIAKNHQLSIGIQGNLIMNRIDFSSLHPENSFDPGIGDARTSTTVFDFNIGIGYKFKGLLLGFSVPNVLQPNARYANPGSEQLNFQYLRHYTAYAQYRISLLKDKFGISPLAFARIAPGNGYQLDGILVLDYNNIVYVGGGYRTAFGVIGMAGVNVLNMFTIAYAYDYTTQPVLNGQAGATHEIIAGFHLPSNFKHKKEAKPGLRNEQTLYDVQKANDSLAQINNASASKLAAERAIADSLARETKALKRTINNLKNNEKAQSAGPDTSKRQASRQFSTAIPVSSPAQLGTTFTLDKILFEYKKAELQPASEEQLDELVKYLRRNPALHILIQGYTDSKGSDRYNQNLSEQRAKAVEDYLTNHGVTDERLQYAGYGKQYPVADNRTEEGRAMNRRVEFTIVQP